MFQAQKRENFKSCCVLQDHYDDERNKTVFHNTTPDQQNQDQDPFWYQTGLVIRPTFSDHITGLSCCVVSLQYKHEVITF